MRTFCALLVLAPTLLAGTLPGRYYELMRAGVPPVRERLAAEPNATLATLETSPGWRHFPSMVLVAAVLHSKQHDAGALDLAFRIGDLLCDEQDKGTYNKRLDHHRDTYMWMEAYRLLEKELGDGRRARWRKALMANLEPLSAEVARMQDYPIYQSPYIGTSPNHYSLWSSTLYVGGKVFGMPEWEKVAGKVLHRFAVEQAPDGFWGEHSDAGPTTDYDYLTACAVALYYEHSKDPAALEALRRSTTFHEYFTWPNGEGVELVNDRNRYGYVSMWGSFGFSHFPDGRRYAEFLLSRYPSQRIALEMLGRMAQNAMYWHEGETAPMPLDKDKFAYRMQVPAGIRKNGPWLVSLSGIVATQAPLNQFYLDRQSAISVYHEKLGLIVSGSNSKRQPELATFTENTGGQVFHLPQSSRFDMSDAGDSVALSYNRFFGVVKVNVDKGVAIGTTIKARGRQSGNEFHLQLCFVPGEALETGGGKKIVIGSEPVELSSEDIGGWIRHHGWTLKTEAGARLKWPIAPFNPYSNGPERGLAHAVALLTVPLGEGSGEFSIALDAN